MSVKKHGFTIVELLIVIVVVGILAAISIISYSGIQQRARDSQRLQDVKTISKALELYFADHGRYPESGCGASCPATKKINASWATTSDGTWTILEDALVPKYISSLPKDPRSSTASEAGIYGGFNYDYVLAGGWCNTSGGQLYLLGYRLESMPQKMEMSGRCTGVYPTDYESSEYVVVRE